jgi:hypothetical protein
VSDLRKAAQQALEALDCIYSPLHVREIDKVGKAMGALRAALAQPEPFNPEWDRVKALEESLREHMAEIHRLKALAQPEQEPVAWRYDEATYRPDDLRGRQWHFNLFSTHKPYADNMVQNVTPLYTAPPQRKPLRTVIYACPICAASLERQE